MSLFKGKNEHACKIYLSENISTSTYTSIPLNSSTTSSSLLSTSLQKLPLIGLPPQLSLSASSPPTAPFSLYLYRLNSQKQPVFKRRLASFENILSLLSSSSDLFLLLSSSSKTDSFSFSSENPSQTVQNLSINNSQILRFPLSSPEMQGKLWKVGKKGNLKARKFELSKRFLGYYGDGGELTLIPLENTVSEPVNGEKYCFEVKSYDKMNKKEKILVLKAKSTNDMSAW
jgi:hypothetical protein